MKIRQWTITIIILAAVISGLYAYKLSLQESASQGTEMFEPSATVNATVAVRVDYQKTLKVSGEVQAFKSLSLHNELAGQIIKLNAKSGSLAKKGQILVEIDHRDEDARLIAAQAQLTLTKQTHRRYLKLKKNNEISDELVDQAQASVEIAKSEVAILETTISKKKLRAPFEAKVGIHNLEMGQYLDNNSNVLSLIGVNEYTWIDFHLPQVYRELSVGSLVKVKPMNQATSFDAIIIAIDPQLARQSRSLKYRAQIKSSLLALKPNTLVSVYSPIAASISLISVPDVAITRDPLGSYVFVLESEGEGAYRAKQVKVILGERSIDTVMVLSGLDEGALIATKGAFKLFPEVKVFIAESLAANTADKK
ncbi:MAG: efflux RND transporter periplasmic adaptor subunit [Colwellia sp.]|nr:efflux RND transporter periplasmic adaptor subunit [Colwellia sp.]